jgi:flavorubredoxin
MCRREFENCSGLEAPVIIVGSPTLNNGVFPSVSELLTYFKGLRPKGKQAVAFKSYGWGGCCKTVEKKLEMAGFGLIKPYLQIRYRHDKEEIAACCQLSEQIAGFV